MPKSVNSGAASAAAAAALDLAPRVKIERTLARSATPESACSEMSRIFNVGRAEVALMRIEHDVLNFLYPAELKAAGFIPLSSSSSVAARTANTRKVELFNNFVIVQHANVFESIKLSELGQSTAPGANTIQKLMSTPVVDSDEKVLGVIQVCHKGLTPDDSGPDFTLSDLQNLELVAKTLARLPFMTAAN
jgi:hypothetical protein